MTIKVFYSKANSTLGEIESHLKENNIAYTTQNVKSERFTWEQFKQMAYLTEDGLDSLLPSKVSIKAWKLLDEIDMDTITLKEFYEFARINPCVIRTPIIMNQNNIMVGFQREEFSVFHNRKDKKSRFNQLLESVRLNEMYQLEEELGYSLA